MELKTINLGGVDVKFVINTIKTESNKQIIFGHSFGRNFNFLSQDDSYIETIRNILNTLKVESSNKTFYIHAEHQDKILVDNDLGFSDAIISIKRFPIALLPADCIGLGIIDLVTGIYGLCHIGRAGVGLNIASKFINQFIDVCGSKENNVNRFKLLLSPHIDQSNYSFDSIDFTSKFEDNSWWGNHKKFIVKKGNSYYVDIGSATMNQIEEAFSSRGYSDKHYKILRSEMSTYSEDLFSHREDRDNNILEKRRNLVFIGQTIY